MCDEYKLSAARRKKLAIKFGRNAADRLVAAREAANAERLRNARRSDDGPSLKNAGRMGYAERQIALKRLVLRESVARTLRAVPPNKLFRIGCLLRQFAGGSETASAPAAER